MANVDCLPKDDLLRALSGEVEAARAEAIARHLEGCERCARLMMELDEAVVRERVPQASSPEVTVSQTQPAELSAVIGKLRGMTPTPGVADTDESCFTLSGSQPHASAALHFEFLSPPQADSEIGRLGPFRVLRLIGQGGMGLVFEAEDVALKRRVAVKVMRPEIATTEATRQRFLSEARAMAAIDHEHVVKVLQCGEANSVPYLAMEFLDGESLAKRLKRGPALSIDEITRIGHDISLGLAAAHERGLIHRDVKPDNVFLQQRAGREPLVKVLDFGLAFSATDSQTTDEQRIVLGTPAFMSPEQARGKPINERSDLFSLGCIFYRMLTGRVPSEGNTPIEALRSRMTQVPISVQLLAPGAPSALAALIDELLAPDPKRRPESARSVAKRLAANLPQTSRTPFSRSRVLSSSAVAVALLIGLVVVFRNAQSTVEPSPEMTAHREAASGEAAMQGDSANSVTPAERVAVAPVEWSLT